MGRSASSRRISQPPCASGVSIIVAYARAHADRAAVGAVEGGTTRVGDAVGSSGGWLGGAAGGEDGDLGVALGDTLGAAVVGAAVPTPTQAPHSWQTWLAYRPQLTSLAAPTDTPSLRSVAHL